MTFWIAQGIGVLICLLASYGYFRKTRARFLRVQVAINILYTAEYLLLGVWSGAVANLISTAKFLSFERDAASGKKTSPKKSLVFCILSIVFGIAVLLEQKLDFRIPLKHLFRLPAAAGRKSGGKSA